MEEQNIITKSLHPAQRLIWISLIILLIVIFFLSLGVGRYYVSPVSVVKIIFSHLIPLEVTWTEFDYSVVMQIRMPRVILAVLVGAALSIAGASFQGIFGNPLASPDALGVSSGTGLGAALALLLFDRNLWIVQTMAMLFGLIAIGITYLISRGRKGQQMLMLILSGVVVTAFFQAMISLVKYIADPEAKLPTITYWLMGSLSAASYRDLGLASIFILAGILILYLLRWRINVLSLNEDEAKSMGVNVTRLRWTIIGAATMVTAATVSTCGFVGWVGLVIPHGARMLVGSDNLDVLPASVLLGSMYLLIIDMIARTATTSEIPLSILTAVVGAPFFAHLLRKTGGGWV
ncbi:MAG: FecCD family ABC transporter permease [Bacillota bacterium]